MASKAVESVRGPVEEKLKQNLAKVIEGKDKVFEQLSNAISSAVNPLLSAALDGVAKASLPQVTSPVSP